MAKVQGVIGSKGSMEDFEINQGGDKFKDKLWKGLKTTGKIALKVLAAAGMIAGGLGAIATLSTTAASVANSVAVAGSIAEVADTVAAVGETFNEGRTNSLEGFELGEMGD